jgi:nitrite reductase/ring-hydroxylating ferredoxin subunit
MNGTWIELCMGSALVNGAQAVSFDVNFAGRTMRAFAVRHHDQVHAYLNECSHVAMEMDWQPNQFWDDTGQWLLCATHGAAYRPDTGACAGGPCRGGLKKIDVQEQEGVVFWRTQYNLHPVDC